MWVNCQSLSIPHDSNFGHCDTQLSDDRCDQAFSSSTRDFTERATHRARGVYTQALWYAGAKNVQLGERHRNVVTNTQRPTVNLSTPLSVRCAELDVAGAGEREGRHRSAPGGLVPEGPHGVHSEYFNRLSGAHVCKGPHVFAVLCLVNLRTLPKSFFANCSTISSQSVSSHPPHLPG